ncbi:putative iron-regulated membrane protein [Filimonas zeae]|uniref:PepSY-associated TM helix domain-containing protein n=1 Tax=Filimonas zeae TaxID=1737353 RepID=UPI00166DC839|nr:PepSY-associated TM helix domain-containing protein [Filimonas zeae]MDR6341363.1 putative iron-regulated membrane protein [Filimonas zeae]
MKTKKIIGKIHLWLGLSSGLVVVILGITGCLLAFEEELQPLFYKQRYFVKETGTVRLPADTLIHIARGTLGHHAPPSSLLSYNDPSRTAAVISYKGTTGWNYFNSIKTYQTVYINPYTGRIQYIENTKLEFFRIVLMLHYNLLLEQTGKYIIGYATIIFIVLLISGLVLWWPKNKAAAKQRFAFRWKETTKWKRKNYDLHNISGFYALLFALIIALTGMVWAFAWFDNGMQWIANGGKASPIEKPFQSTPATGRQTNVFNAILSDMQAKAPGDLYDISIPQDDSSAIYGYSQWMHAQYKWTSFYYNQHSGKNLSASYFHQKTRGEQLRSMNYDIHAGSIANMPGRIIMFIVSFICAGLPVTGLYIWIGRRKKTLKPLQASM